MYNPQRKGSAKVVGAQRRIEKEMSWLEQVTVQADDPDLVLNDNGERLPLPALAETFASEDSPVEFFANGAMITGEMILDSFAVIESCRRTIKRLLKG
jgi:hypothetical protein